MPPSDWRAEALFVTALSSLAKWTFFYANLSIRCFLLLIRWKKKIQKNGATNFDQHTEHWGCALVVRGLAISPLPPHLSPTRKSS